MKEATSKENDDRNGAAETTGGDEEMKGDAKGDDRRERRRSRSGKRDRSRDRRRPREEGDVGEERESKRSRRDDDDHW